MTDKILIDRAVVEQALKLLDALSYDENYDYDGCFQHWADYAQPEKLALQFGAALEQPQVEQEPVAVTKIIGMDEFGPMLLWHRAWTDFPVGTKLYTRPQPPRQSLTDDEIERLWYQSWGGALPFARNIERVYGIGE